MQKQTLISKYENMMMKDEAIRLSGTKDEKEIDALVLVRYIIEELMGWSPQDAFDCITPEIAKTFRLDVLYKYVVSCPRDIDKSIDYDYLVYRAYPKSVIYDIEKKTIDVYDRLIAGELERFPKNFFAGESCRTKLYYILLYAIRRSVPTREVGDLYRLFSDPKKITSKLRAWKLYQLMRQHFSSPLEFLHLALKNIDTGKYGGEADDFLFNHYQFQKAYTHMKKIVENEERMESKAKKVKKELVKD